jgi:hypothetical protein
MRGSANLLEWPDVLAYGGGKEWQRMTAELESIWIPSLH